MAEQFNETLAQKQSGKIHPYQNSRYPQNTVGNARGIDPNSTYSPQYHTISDNMATLNDRRSYAAYNGTYGLKNFQPFATRPDLLKIYNKNDPLMKTSRKRYYINDQKNFSTQARTHSICQCSLCRKQQAHMKKTGLPLINNRYRYGVTPNSKNTNKIKNNYSMNETDYQNKNGEYETKKNYSCDKTYTSAVNLKTANKGVENLKEDEKMKKSDTLNYFTSTNYKINPNFRRTFHKAQIFNNYKPFLVENFIMFADYA